MSPSLLVRDVMRIGAPTCKETDPLDKVAALMIEGGHTAIIVLDEDADARGWINEQMVDHIFFMHHAGGRSWPASVLHWRDVVKALAGPEYLKHQGMHGARPTPMDLFRLRHGLPAKR